MPARPEAKIEMFYGWRVVATGFVIAAFAWGLGLFEYLPWRGNTLRSDVGTTGGVGRNPLLQQCGAG